MTTKFLQGGALLLGLTALLAACNAPDTTQPPIPAYACPVGSTVTPISAVQGTGAASPLINQTVTVRGVVTQDAQAGLSGFFVQDVTPDSDPKTSEGLFVFTATAPNAVKVGEVLEISGTVKEFFGSTQLDSVTTVTSCGTTTLPAPTKLTYPLSAPDALENVEGMLVTVTNTMTVTNTFTLGRFGELGLSSGGRLFNPTNGQGGTLASNALRTLVLDDGISKQNPSTVPYLNADNTRRAGDTVTGLEGVMHYANNAYKLEPTKAPAFVNTNPRTAAPKSVGDSTLKVAGANVLNYFTTLGDVDSNARGADNALEFARQKAKIVAELRALDADVITLMEIENNGETALDDLVAALNTAAGKAEYASVKTGKVGTDAIRVAVIYRPGKVETVGSARTDTNPVYSRPPVAQTFRDLAGKGVFTVVANHFKSKGSCPTTGDVDTGQGCWNMQRVQQSAAVLAFADKLKITDSDVLLMGDLNAYGEEDPIKALETGGFESLNKRIALEDRYSYQFDGQFGYLDHALASAGLGNQVTGITEWHINSDEPTVLDYNTEFKTPEQITALYAPNAYRSSDHDPVVVGLKLKADGATTIPVTVSATGPDTATVGKVYTITVTAGGLQPTVGGNLSPDSLTADWGDGAVEGLFPVEPVGPHIHTYKDPGTYTIKVTATRTSDKATDTTTLKVTVTNPTTPQVGGLVISQVYGGGGNAGAQFKNDFVELFNAGKVAISTAGKSVQYASNAGNFNFVLPLPAATIQPGAYYLVGMASGGSNGNDLPTPEAVGTSNFSGSNGKLALASNTDPVTGIADTDLLDFVGYGTANESEGNAAAPGLSNTTAAVRAGNGCTDANKNSADFTAVAPTPRNSASPKNVCP